ncbi:MAG: four helix bundle protein [Ignavibacterium sp.]
MNYKDLEIWQLAREIVIEIHKMTLSLPKFEMFEEGSQIRRSSKSTKSNIVEGFGRRNYKNEFLRYLTFALASNDETLDHLENLFETGSLNDQKFYMDMHDKIEILGKKINRFLQSVQNDHLSEK